MQSPIQLDNTTTLTKVPAPVVEGSNESSAETISYQSKGAAPKHRFNLPPKEDRAKEDRTNERRRAASLKRCRMFSEPETITVKQATTKEELEAAYRLVHESYVEAGYMDAHPSGMRVRIFEALPQTVTFIAQENGQVIGTMSLVLDSPLGLPMEESFGEELDGLRHQGRRIAEVSSLAVAKGCRNLGVFVRLCRLMTLYAIRGGIDDLCIGISPEHAAFFQEVYLFEELGSLRSYSSSKEDFVVGLRLNLNTFPNRCRTAYEGSDEDANFYKFMFEFQQDRVGFPQNPSHLSVMTPDLIRYFFIEQTDVLREADNAALSLLQNGYPYLNVYKLLSEALASSVSAQEEEAAVASIPSHENLCNESTAMTHFLSIAQEEESHEGWFQEGWFVDSWHKQHAPFRKARGTVLAYPLGSKSRGSLSRHRLDRLRQPCSQRAQTEDVDFRSSSNLLQRSPR